MWLGENAASTRMCMKQEIEIRCDAAREALIADLYLDHPLTSSHRARAGVPTVDGWIAVAGAGQ